LIEGPVGEAQATQTTWTDADAEASAWDSLTDLMEIMKLREVGRNNEKEVQGVARPLHEHRY